MRSATDRPGPQDRRHLPNVRLQDRGAGGLGAQPEPHRRRRAGGRAGGHRAVRGPAARWSKHPLTDAASASRGSPCRSRSRSHENPSTRQSAQVRPAGDRGRPAHRAPAGARPRGRARRRRGALPDRPGAGRSGRRCSSAWRSGASWSRRPTRNARGCGLDNVRCVFANMSVDMPRLFAPASVRRFFLNFPDPWFKSRQHKRRVIGPALSRRLGGRSRRGASSTS